MAPAMDIATEAAIASENKKSVKVLDELFAALSVAEDPASAAKNIAHFINGPIEEHDAPTQ